MKNQAIQECMCESRRCSTCPAGKITGLDRRQFLSSVIGATAAVASARLGLFDLVSSASAAVPEVTGGPKIRVIFVRPEKEPDVSWPGGNCDIPAQQALFVKALKDAAPKLGITLDIREEPLCKPADITALLDQLKQSPPDGLIVGAMSLVMWGSVNEIVQKKGDIPTIVYSHVSGFTGHMQHSRKIPRTFMAATPDIAWLATALRMFATNWRIRNSRILMVTRAGEDSVLKAWGTTLHSINRSQFETTLKDVKETDEVLAIAKSYRKNADKIVEPTKQEVIDAARNYVTCRSLMDSEKCNGISIACLGWKNPVCMSFSKLLDEGVPAVCEADRNAIIGELVALNLLDRPGFIQDPSPDTVKNTFIGSHCTSPTRLKDSSAKERAPYWLRSYHTRTGCSMEVMWPIGEEVTVLHVSADSPGMYAGTGRVVSNIMQPPTGCCRTAVEISMDNVADTRDVKGFHQLFLLGNHEKTLRAYGQLFDVKVERIA